MFLKNSICEKWVEKRMRRPVFKILSEIQQYYKKQFLFFKPIILYSTAPKNSAFSQIIFRKLLLELFFIFGTEVFLYENANMGH